MADIEWQTYSGGHMAFNTYSGGPTVANLGWWTQGRPQDFFAGGAKPGTIDPIFFFSYVWMPCCIPDLTIIEKVYFRLQCYVT